jgi:IMP dehydrogenase/GMP reductase
VSRIALKPQPSIVNPGKENDMRLNRPILSSIGTAAVALTLAVALAAPAGASPADPESAGPVEQGGTAQPAHVIQGSSPLEEWINSLIQSAKRGDPPCVNCAQPASR